MEKQKKSTETIYRGTDFLCKTHVIAAPDYLGTDRLTILLFFDTFQFGILFNIQFAY